MSLRAHATQSLKRLQGKRHLVLTTRLHPVLRERPDGFVEGDLRPSGFHAFSETRARQHDEEQKIRDNLGRRRRPQLLHRGAHLGMRKAGTMISVPVDLVQQFESLMGRVADTVLLDLGPAENNVEALTKGGNRSNRDPSSRAGRPR